MLDTLLEQAQRLGKPSWRSMLTHVAQLHEAHLHSPVSSFQFLWEEVPGGGEEKIYCDQWRFLHCALDTLSAEPQHAIRQVKNHLSLQQDSGFIPGWVWLENGFLHWNEMAACPPLWPIVVGDYLDQVGGLEDLPLFLKALSKQIHWFEKHRKTEEGGFFYLDILDRIWESGMREAPRFDLKKELPSKFACVDACSHLYKAYCLGQQWSQILGENPHPWQKKAEQLALWVNQVLFDESTGLYFDQWAVGTLSGCEGFWPLIAGIADSSTVRKSLDKWLLHPKCFGVHHSLSSLPLFDPRFELAPWKGPVYNLIVYWVARGLCSYGNYKEACELLEKALTSSADYFEKTGKVWEYYPPQGEDIEQLQPSPIADDLGSNPLIAMAAMWSSLSE